MKKPEVSIIMNCYNGEKYLADSLKSIINQTYKNWELIFWNNSSNDNSKKIFRKFNNKRFKYFENKKLKKLYDVRNLAIKKAKGVYISFLDTDDLWKKNKLETQVKLIKKKKLDFVYSKFYTIHNDKNFSISRRILPSGFITQQLLKNYSLGILTVLMRKTLFSKYKFDKRYNIIGDFDYFIKLSSIIEMFAIQKPLAFYRSHSNNFSKIKLKMYYEELNEWQKKNNKWFKTNNYDTSNVNLFRYKLIIRIIINKIVSFFKH